jgi:hypothetical protein
MAASSSSLCSFDEELVLSIYTKNVNNKATCTSRNLLHLNVAARAGRESNLMKSTWE